MNNILTFEDYKKMNIRQVESVIYRQFIEENIKEESIVNEGLIRKAINKMSGKFIQNALADEIEKGKELEKSIKEALDGLDKGFEELKKKIDVNANSDENSKSKVTAIEKVKEAIKAVQSQAFDTLTMIGSEGEIDFAGFLGSATVATAINFGVILTPIRSVFMLRKAYKYFLGIIKQTIRRNLLVIQLNFDQFENLILQKSFESEEDSETMTKSNTIHDIIAAMQEQLCGKDSKMFNKKKSKEMKDYLDNFKKAQDMLIKQNRENNKHNPLRSLWEDQHNNTYTRTLEQIKQYINDDSQKELDALKNSITKLGTNDVDLTLYGELLISAAEEYAIHTNHGINNNFIKMSSVFNLDNQKKLIELIVSTQEENQRELEKRKSELDSDAIKEKAEKDIAEGKSIYEEKLKDTTESYTFDKFNDTFDDADQQRLRKFFQSEDGQDAYKELTEKNPLYKYFLFSDIALSSTFFNSINDLKIVEVYDMDSFYSTIIDKEYVPYYISSERSIRDVMKEHKSDKYFGFKISDDDVVDNIIKDTLTESNKINKLLSDNVLGRSKKKRYYLTFVGSGNGLFDILHKDFKTTIFDESGEYEKNISAENKKTLMQIIHKNLKIGNDVSSILAEYLVRLEAHMLLKKKDPWFIAKDNNILFKECFDPDSTEILNKNAFVEINSNDYEDIKNFLTKYHSLSENDFDISSNKDEKNKKE